MDESVRELCNTVLDYMDELSSVIIVLHEEIRGYNLSNIAVLGDISEGLAWLLKAVGSLNNNLMLNIDNEIDLIRSQINDVALAMQNSDYLFLADILEFDIIPNMEKIFNVVRDV